ncbi:MAG: oxidoreductase, partial [Succinatimonas sp.]|nr:oxidoreductase [Succinatimonas sp.]
VICSEESNLYPEALNIDLKEYAFLKENVLLQEEIIEAFFFEDLDKAYVNIRKKKPIPDVSDIFFEKNWTDFLTGNIFIDSD